MALATLGPGATNLVTGVADAYLDRAPLVVLTGQGDLERLHKESHQYIDVVSLMRPVTKWNAQVSDPAIIPEAVCRAFAVAETEKPGATHLELPEDVHSPAVGDDARRAWAARSRFQNAGQSCIAAKRILVENQPPMPSHGDCSTTSGSSGSPTPPRTA